MESKPHKTFFNWSTGKDAALALHQLQSDPSFHVDQLITTINSHFDRVTMHGLRREFLIKQAEEIGLPYSTIELPEQPSMQEYEERMKKEMLYLKKKGYTHAAYGDIFLEDLRIYRENQLEECGLKTVFPIWKRDTTSLIHFFLDQGFRAVIVAANGALLDESFIGREIDRKFLSDLPSHVDPCGENGEFHTFCFDGPIFKNPIPFNIGEKTHREYNTPNEEGKTGFWFCDLLPI